MKSGHGGKRKGAGRRFGTKWPSTLAKEATRELVRLKINEHLEPMLNAHIAHAQGIQHFVLRTKDGKFEKVTSEAAALAAMNDPESVYEFWTKDPSVQAFTDLMNRALDKPREQVQEIAMSLSVDDRKARLRAALLRVKETK